MALTDCLSSHMVLANGSVFITKSPQPWLEHFPRGPGSRSSLGGGGGAMMPLTEALNTPLPLSDTHGLTYSALTLTPRLSDVPPQRADQNVRKPEMPDLVQSVSMREGQPFLRLPQDNVILLSLVTTPEMALFAGPYCDWDAEGDVPGALGRFKPRPDTTPPVLFQHEVACLVNVSH